jgi:hypothetical protein
MSTETGNVTDEDIHDELVFEGDKVGHDERFPNCHRKHHYNKNKKASRENNG